MQSHPSKSSRKRNRRQILNRNKRTKSRGARSKTLGFDCLERRLLLATFVVNSTVDDALGTVDGLISLREATIAANTNAPFGDAPAGDLIGDSIRFDPTLDGSTSPLTEGEIEITDDLFIQAGSLEIAVDAQSNSRIFNVNTSQTVGFGSLHLVGGQANLGGAILSNAGGTTLLNGVTFMNNTATGVGGGAIYHAAGSLFATDSIFVSNEATGDSGSGGALLMLSGNAGFFNGSMLENVANRAGGAIEIVDGSFYSSNLQVGADGQGNLAGPDGSAAPGNGGGLHVTGSATVTIIGGQYVDNFAAQEGGGLWNQSGTDLFLFDTEITNNIANGNSSDDGGGGIFNNGGRLEVRGATITGNSANGVLGSGGGIFSIGGNVLVISSAIESNVANRAGGGIEIVNGRFALRDSTLGGDNPDLGNVAGPDGTAAPGNGGGLHVTGGSAEVFVRDSVVSNNVAASEGGGLWNSAGSTMQVDEGSVVSSNTASGDDADNGGGGIFNNGGTLTINGATITNNVSSGAAGSGGGIFSSDGIVTISSSTIDSNMANRAGGGIEIVEGRLVLEQSILGGAKPDLGNIAGPDGFAAPGNGGGLHVTGSTAQVFVRGTNVENNFAASEGGGLWNQAGSFLRVDENSIVSSNTAHGNDADNGGGGIFNNGGRLTVIDSIISDNIADGTLGSGGGIFSTAGDVLITLSNIHGNVANRAGGGIEIVNGLLNFNDSKLGGEMSDQGNIAGPHAGTAAPGNGGGLHVTGIETEVYVRRSDVSNNVAASEGGGLWNQAGSLMRIDDTIIESNTAQGNDSDNGGGGIFNNGGRLTLKLTDIRNNNASGESGSGGGLLSTDGPVLMFDTSIDGNAAARAGGGIELINGTLRVNDSFLSNNDAGITYTASPGNGGGLHISGDMAEVFFRNTMVNDNHAASEGGGLWNQAGSFIRIDQESQVSSNEALGDDADNGGGGIFNNGGRVTINNSTISGNLASGAAGSGGGLLSTDGNVLIFDSDIDRNSAVRAGGGIEIIDGLTRLTNVLVLDNDAGITLAANPGNGGGLHVSGNDSRVVMVDSVFEGNSAQNQGGGLWNQTDSAIVFNGNNRIINNTAVTGVGGGVYSRGHLQIMDTVFEQNSSGDNGGGIFLTETGSSNVFDSEFNGNTSAASGGGIFNGNFLRAENSDFIDNVAAIDGGGIFTEAGATTILSGNNFSGNVPNDQN